MAKKRKTLPDNLQEIIDSNDIERFKTVFDKCEISATNRGKTTKNVFSYKNLTEKHICFLAENGFDLNADSGWGKTPAAFLADNLDLLKCLIEYGADIEYAVDEIHGNALYICAWTHRAQAVENLLSCGADPEPRGGWEKNTALDEALRCCRGIDLINMVRIAKALLAAGAKPSDKTYGYVTNIGEDFEFRRSDFNPELLDKYSCALDELYSVFKVEPVPRRAVYDGRTPITVSGETWQERYNKLWKLLVPGSGHANTVQGEVIRIVGRITNELLDNGGINWDSEYRKMVASLPAYFRTFGGEAAEKACSLAAKISSNSDEKLLYTLTETAVEWVLKNNEPVALDTVDYKR